MYEQLHHMSYTETPLMIIELNCFWMTLQNTIWPLQRDLLCVLSEVNGAWARLLACWALPLRAFFCSFMVSDDFFLISWRDLLYSWNRMNRDALVTGMQSPLGELWSLSCISNVNVNRNASRNCATKSSLIQTLMFLPVILWHKIRLSPPVFVCHYLWYMEVQLQPWLIKLYDQLLICEPSVTQQKSHKQVS